MEPTKGTSSLASKPNSGYYDIMNFINKCLRNWKWFVLSLVVFVALAFVYLRYTTPQFSSSATIMLIEDKAASPQSALFEDMDMFSGKYKKVEDEIQIMRSRRLITNVVKKLKLNFEYYTEGRIHEQEVYPTPPVKLSFIVSDSIINLSRMACYIEIKSSNTFSFWLVGSEQKKDYAFGEKVPSPLGDVVITPTYSDMKKQIGIKLRVNIKSVESIASNLQNRISIVPSIKGSNIVEISMNHPIKEKSRDIINTLMEEYNRNSIREKSLVSKNSLEFIDNRIGLIAADLSDIDNVVERYKTGRGLTDIGSEASLYLNSGSLNEQELISANTQLSMANYMKETVDSEDSYELIPANIGLSDPTITSVTAKYNELVLERQRLLKSSNEMNPVIVNLDQQLDGLKESMKQSLGNLKSTLGIRINNLRDQEARINSKIYSVPGQERELRDVTRQQQIKEALFLYLLQKREESAIATAATSPSATIVDEAYTRGGPVSPKGNIIYLGAAFLGLLVPFSIMYLRDLLDTKVHNKEDLEKEIMGVQVLAEIPKVDEKNEMVIQPNDRSVLAESFRIMRTNLDYYIRARGNNPLNKVIYVTSTINGEGKSFVAFNLALTLGFSGKKVVLVGADIRNPGLNLYIEGSPSERGLTEYLIDGLKERDIISPLYADDSLVDVIHSGKIPPNPAELLMSDKMESLFSYLNEKYDYVIVDTSPCMLVTDTLLISKYAQHTIYVTRADYTDKRMLAFPAELYDTKKLNGMTMVVNDVKATNFGYGARYGYGYYGNSRKAKKSQNKKKRFKN